MNLSVTVRRKQAENGIRVFSAWFFFKHQQGLDRICVKIMTHFCWAMNIERSVSQCRIDVVVKYNKESLV